MLCKILFVTITLFYMYLIFIHNHIAVRSCFQCERLCDDFLYSSRLYYFLVRHSLQRQQELGDRHHERPGQGWKYFIKILVKRGKYECCAVYSKVKWNQWNMFVHSQQLLVALIYTFRYFIDNYGLMFNRQFSKDKMSDLAILWIGWS